MKLSLKGKASLALLGTVFLWSFLVVIARGAVAGTSPMTLLFIRFLVAAICFAPFFIKQKPWKNHSFKKLAAVSLGSTINVVFFIWGIQYTTASASQLIYAAIPILIILLSPLLFKEHYPVRRIIGVLIGLLGIFVIVYLSAIEKGTTIAGSLIGNLATMIGMFGWTSYIMFSKRLTKVFSPVEIGSVSIMVSFVISVFLLLGEMFLTKSSFQITPGGLWAGIYMGFFGTFLAYLLHQYALKHVSALTVSLTSYIQPVTTFFLAVIFLGEKLTTGFLFGSVLVFFGIFSSTTLEIYHRRK